MDYALSRLASSSLVCDHPAGQTPFDAEAYMGIWIEQQHVHHENFQPDGWTCNTAQYYDLDAATGKFTVSNTSES